MHKIGSNNDFMQFINLTKSNPNRFSQSIHKLIKKQELMLNKYDFHLDKGKKIINWIEKFCYLVDGESSGKLLKLPLWQKWLIHSIFGFYGDIPTPTFDEEYNYIGDQNKYVRIVNDITLLVGSGNSKTTFLSALNCYFMFSRDYKAPKIFIGSGAYKTSKLCFEATEKMMRKNKVLAKNINFRGSIGEIENFKTNSKLTAMSSIGNNNEGIVNFLTIFDECHTLTTSSYIDNIKKSAKRDDQLFIEISTQGTCRNGYLDGRLDYLKNILDNNIDNDRVLPILFEQDSEEEIFEAYNNQEYDALFKANPSLGITISTTIILEKIKEMIDDPSKKIATLTKNFNVPQNESTCFFTEKECRALPFDESIFKNAPIFIGLDMAYTRSNEDDLCCLTIMTKNPITEKEYFKDFYFLPKYWSFFDKSKEETVKLDMIKYKSKFDSQMAYDVKNEKYGYQAFIDHGDVVVVDETLIEKLVKSYGQKAYNDCTGLTQNFIIYFLCYLEKQYNFTVCKAGIDPNKANEIMAFINQKIRKLDGLDVAISFQMEKYNYSTPILQSTKDVRARGLVYCNNKLTELHHATVTFKEKGEGILLTNPKRLRKDGVIAHLAARSAFNVFVNNSKTGAQNKDMLINYWQKRGNK